MPSKCGKCLVIVGIIIVLLTKRATSLAPSRGGVRFLSSECEEIIVWGSPE